MAYTPTTLALYMRDGVLRSTGAVLGLTEEAQYAEAVTDVLHAYPAADLVAATDLALVRLLAQREAWKLALGVAAGDYNYSENGANFSRAQVFDHIKAMYTAAVEAVDRYRADSSGGGDGSGGTSGNGGRFVSARVQATW